jgi:hypothetical protein
MTEPSAPPSSPSPPTGTSPPARGRESSRIGGVVIGLIVLGIGVYFLLRETLQISLPDIGELWPIIVIIIGAAILYNGLRRSSA